MEIQSQEKSNVIGSRKWNEISLSLKKKKEKKKKNVSFVGNWN
jgi:hypothetical protein